MTALLNAYERGEVSCIFDTKTEKIIEEVAQIPTKEPEEELMQKQEIDELDQILNGIDDFENDF